LLRSNLFKFQPEGKKNMSRLNSRWKRFAGWVFLVLSILAFVVLVAPRFDSEDFPPDQVLKEERALMGTTWQVQVSIGVNEASGTIRAAIEEVFSELARIDGLMSEWKPNSPVSAINAAAGEGLVPVPEELRAMIERAIAFGEVTEGAFDITWKGLAPLWRFDEAFRVPDSEDVEAALDLVDFRKIKIDGNRIGLTRQGMALGLGGMAKGYAIDRAADILRSRDLQNFLVNGGGDVLTSGDRAGEPWKIGIRTPRGGRNELIAHLSVSAAAVVTSGDYERFKVVDGIRYHHIIDPRTGRPARACQSVTVVAPTAEDADVLATAIFVQGPARGFQLIHHKPFTEAFVIDDSGKFWMTDGFQDLAEFY
jgi:thiamine biosynthesis lipoprotein